MEARLGYSRDRDFEIPIWTSPRRNLRSEASLNDCVVKDRDEDRDHEVPIWTSPRRNLRSDASTDNSVVKDGAEDNSIPMEASPKNAPPGLEKHDNEVVVAQVHVQNKCKNTGSVAKHNNDVVVAQDQVDVQDQASNNGANVPKKGSSTWPVASTVAGKECKPIALNKELWPDLLQACKTQTQGASRLRGLSSDPQCGIRAQLRGNSSDPSERKRNRSMQPRRSDGMAIVWVCPECRAKFDTSENLQDHQISESHWSPTLEETGRTFIRKSKLKADQEKGLLNNPEDVSNEAEEAEESDSHIAPAGCPRFDMADKCESFDMADEDEAEPLTRTPQKAVGSRDLADESVESPTKPAINQVASSTAKETDVRPSHTLLRPSSQVPEAKLISPQKAPRSNSRNSRRSNSRCSRSKNRGCGDWVPKQVHV